MPANLLRRWRRRCRRAKSLPPVASLNLMIDLPVMGAESTAAEPAARARPVVAASRTAEQSQLPAADGMPELDAALLASLPRGTVLTSAPATPRVRTPAPAAEAPGSCICGEGSFCSDRSVGATFRQRLHRCRLDRRRPQPGAPPSPRAHALTASVAVLSGPAAGKRYPDQASVTLGKEGQTGD